MGGNMDDFLRLDLELHRLTWKLTGNDFLPRQWEQVALPLVAFFPFRAT